MSTYSAKASEIKKDWVLIDAEGLVVGRLASVIATRLRGKHKPSYTPHMDCGDNVVVINAEKVVLTGNKMKGKIFYYHTGFPGGIKERVGRQDPDRQIPRARGAESGRAHAARRRSRPRAARPLVRLCRPEHKQTAQQPKPLDVKSMNPKNVRR